MTMKWMYVMMIALFFAACGDDNEYVSPVDERQEEVEIETVPIQLQLSVNGITTYAATDTDDKNTTEKGTIDEVELYIFGSNGFFYEYKKLGVSPTTYKSDPCQLPIGNWYIYAFIHKPVGFIQEPVEGTTIYEFEQQTVTVGIGSNYTNWYPDLVQLMGTLVRSTTTVYGSGTSTVPETIRLEVGHLVSKIAVNQDAQYKSPEVKGDYLKGSFIGIAGGNNIRYNVSHEVKKMHLVGQWEGTFRYSQPFSPHFYNCDLTEVFYLPVYTYHNLSNYYYAIENVNQNPTYANSTCFIVEYRYTPHPDEVYDIVNHQPGGSITNNNFWLAEFTNGSKLIYNEDPTNHPHPILGVAGKVNKYNNGLCYYRVPIADQTEDIPSRRYAVLRNHSYLLTVKSISFLGKPDMDDWDDREPPLGPEQEIDIEVAVNDWVDYDIPVHLD